MLDTHARITLPRARGSPGNLDTATEAPFRARADHPRSRQVKCPKTPFRTRADHPQSERALTP